MMNPMSPRDFSIETGLIALFAFIVRLNNEVLKF